MDIMGLYYKKSRTCNNLQWLCNTIGFICLVSNFMVDFLFKVRWISLLMLVIALVAFLCAILLDVVGSHYLKLAKKHLDIFLQNSTKEE